MAKCVGCGKRAVHDHHLVKRQRIRKRLRTLTHKLGHAPYGITRALEDKRLQVPLCGTCHPEVEDERRKVELPEGFWDAVDAYSLAPDLPRWVGVLYDERLIAMRAEEDETEDTPPAHVPGQINLDGEVETDAPVGPPEGMEWTSDGPRRIDRYTNTVEDAAKFEQNS